mgnify:CR=1 FL=1
MQKFLQWVRTFVGRLTIKRVLLWLGAIIGGLIGLLVVLIVILAVLGTMLQLNKKYDIQVAAVNIPTDAEGIERGRHIVQSYGLCVECHGGNLGGDVMEEDPVLANWLAATSPLGAVV